MRYYGAATLACVILVFVSWTILSSTGWFTFSRSLKKQSQQVFSLYKTNKTSTLSSECSEGSHTQVDFSLPESSASCFGLNDPSTPCACLEMEGNELSSKLAKQPQVQLALIVGAMKSGTTFLHDSLSKLPQVYTPTCKMKERLQAIKEAHFWDQICISQAQLDKYENLFHSLASSHPKINQRSVRSLCNLQTCRSILNKSADAQNKKNQSHTSDKGSSSSKQNKQVKVYLESTPAYLRVPSVACKISKYWPGAKIIIVLRDPVDRLISQYLMDSRVRYYYRTQMHKLVPPLLDFGTLIDRQMQAIAQFPCISGGATARYSDCLPCRWQAPTHATACNIHPKRKKTNSGLRFDMSSANPLKKGNHHLVGGVYGLQLAEYLRYFHPKDILVVDHAQMDSDPVKVVKYVAEFLGLDASDVDDASILEKKRTKPVENHHQVEEDQPGLSEQSMKDIEQYKQTLAQWYYPLNQDLYRLLEELGYDNFTKFESDRLVE